MTHKGASISSGLRVLERTLVILGAVCLGSYLAVQMWSAWQQVVAARELDEMRASFDAARDKFGSRRPSAPHASVVGRIELTRLGVNAVVREGDDERILRTAVGHIPFTALPGEPGNAALAGHRDTFFRGLRDVRNGDRIVVTTPAAVHQYVVRDHRVVEPTDVSVLDSTPGRTLTLVTCYPFTYLGAAPKRFVVRAELIE